MKKGRLCDPQLLCYVYMFSKYVHVNFALLHRIRKSTDYWFVYQYNAAKPTATQIIY